MKHGLPSSDTTLLTGNVSLPIGIVLVYYEPRSTRRTFCPYAARLQNTLAGLFIPHHVSNTRTLWGGILGVRTVYIQAPAVPEQLVQQSIVIRRWTLLFPFHFKTSGIN